MEFFNGSFNGIPVDWKQSILQLYASKSVHTVPPTNFLEEWWLNTVLYFGDFNMLIMFYLFMNVSYAIGGIFFWIIDQFQLLHKFKVQQDKYPNAADYAMCFRNLVQNYLFVIVPLIYCLYPIFALETINFQMALPLPHISTFLWQFTFCLIVEDVGHYWLHRLLHTPYFYKSIHKVHHTYSAPFGFVASYSHPLEVIILGIPTFLGPLIIRTHYFTFFSWVLFRQLDAVLTHSGYDLPHPFDLLPYYGGVVEHDFHHKVFIWNYSSRFTFMDKWCGTYKERASYK